MLLHTVNALPSSAAFQECLRTLQPGDALLLLGDGTYAASAASDAMSRLRQSGAELYALDVDIQLNGVRIATDAIQLTDMDGFVALTERFPRHLCWY